MNEIVIVLVSIQMVQEGSNSIFMMWKNYLGELGMVKSLPFFSLVITESIPLFWNAIKWSKSPRERNHILLTEFQKAIPKLYLQKQAVTFRFSSKFDGTGKKKELAIHPPRQHLSNVKITLNGG